MARIGSKSPVVLVQRWSCTDVGTQEVAGSLGWGLVTLAPHTGLLLRVVRLCRSLSLKGCLCICTLPCPSGRHLCIWDPGWTLAGRVHPFLVIRAEVVCLRPCPSGKEKTHGTG